MSLKILKNAHYSTVVTHLQFVCSNDLDRIQINNATGKVEFLAGPRSMEGHLVAFLVENEHDIYIAGMDYNEPIVNDLMCQYGVFWSIGQVGSQVNIIVHYDPTECNGTGYVGYNKTGGEIPRPSVINLVFGIAGAIQLASAPNPILRLGMMDLNSCLEVENEVWRAPRWISQRAGPLEGYGRACPVQPYKRTSPPPPPPPVEEEHSGWTFPVPGCFIASAAYESPLADEVEFLRRLRDDVLVKSRAGERWFRHFYEHYYRVSPAIAARMREDPEFARLMRFGIVEPIVRYLRIALQFPDASLAQVAEPWSTFLRDLLAGLEDWSQALDLPTSFEGMRGLDAVQELTIVLQYLLRTPERRAVYLSHLEESGALPLRLDPGEANAARHLLIATGRTDSEIVRVLGGGRVFGKTNKEP